MENFVRSLNMLEQCALAAWRLSSAPSNQYVEPPQKRQLLNTDTVLSTTNADYAIEQAVSHSQTASFDSLPLTNSRFAPFETENPLLVISITAEHSNEHKAFSMTKSLSAMADGTSKFPRVENDLTADRTLSIGTTKANSRNTPLSEHAGFDSINQLAAHLASIAQVDFGTEHRKPPYSYAQLIIQAIASSPNQRSTLAEIYAHIYNRFPYYKIRNKGWKNSIRHNLSLNRIFVRVPRMQSEAGKGAFWQLVPTCDPKLVGQAFHPRQKLDTVVSRGTSAQRKPSALPSYRRLTEQKVDPEGDSMSDVENVFRPSFSSRGFESLYPTWSKPSSNEPSAVLPETSLAQKLGTTS